MDRMLNNDDDASSSRGIVANMEFKLDEDAFDPRSLPKVEDDTCRFAIHLDPSLSPSDYLVAITEYLASLTSQPHFSEDRPWIWQGGPPALRVKEDDDDNEGRHIEGEVKYGDSIEDEWFVVWCLREVTKRWKDEGCVVGVRDGDGEFLLVEAADALPKWVTPEVADGRVWLKNGQLHLIPPFSKPIESISASVALPLLSGPSASSTLAPPGVSWLINKRLEAATPEALITQHLHTTTAYLQSDVVKALSVDPGLVSEAVKVCYERDPQNVKAAHSMRRFSPSISPSLSTLHLTRPLYAQLMHQRFHLPRPFTNVNWLPSSIKEGTDEWRRRDIGMKIVVGFEMAYEAARQAAGSEGQAFRKRVDEAIAKAGQMPLAPGIAAEEDSDSWLTVDESQLDDIMSSKVAPNGKAKAQSGGADDEEEEEDEDEKMAEAEATKMRSFAAKLEGFVEGRGAFEGATMEEDDDDDDGLSSDASSDSEQDDLAADLDMLDDQGKVRPGKGKRGKMDDSERQKRMDGLVHGLEEGEWGAKTQTQATSVGGTKTKAAAADLKTEDVEMVDAEIGSSAALAVSDKTRRTSTNGKSAPPDVAPPRLARPTYDGVVDESSDEEDDERAADDPFRPGGPGLATLDEEEKLRGGQGGDENEDEDMGGEEEEFLAFARDALGLTEEQYEVILESRRKKGAYVPAGQRSSVKTGARTSRPAEERDPATASVPATTHLKGPKGKGKGKGKEGRGVRFTEPSEPFAIPPSSHTPNPRPDRPERNPNLATFDALMERIDAELQKSKQAQGSQRRGGPVRPMGPDLGVDSGSEEEDDEEVDFDAAMDAELAELLKKGGSDLGAAGGEGGMDYGLVANFLESFKAQAGMAGPVGNLAGLMGVDLPRWKE